jgi:hypothetical protein
MVFLWGIWIPHPYIGSSFRTKSTVAGDGYSLPHSLLLTDIVDKYVRIYSCILLYQHTKSILHYTNQLHGPGDTLDKKERNGHHKLQKARLRHDSSQQMLSTFRFFSHYQPSF